MALLDDLVSQVPDLALMASLQKAITDLRRKQKFGLVFEEHIPETTAIFGLPIPIGALVQRRQGSEASAPLRVARLQHGTLKHGTLSLLTPSTRAPDILVTQIVLRQFYETL